jgi:hypothetical protein
MSSAWSQSMSLNAPAATTPMDPDHDVVLGAGKDVADLARARLLVRPRELARLQARRDQLRPGHEEGGGGAWALERDAAADEVRQACDRGVLPLEQDALITRRAVAPFPEQQLGAGLLLVHDRREGGVEDQIDGPLAEQTRHPLGVVGELDARPGNSHRSQLSGQVVRQGLKRRVVLPRVAAHAPDDEGAACGSAVDCGWPNLLGTGPPRVASARGDGEREENQESKQTRCRHGLSPGRAAARVAFGCERPLEGFYPSLGIRTTVERLTVPILTPLMLLRRAGSAQGVLPGATALATAPTPPWWPKARW